MADSAVSAVPAPKSTRTVKLVLLGESAVGKSSLVSRFVKDSFETNKEPTIGAAFFTKKCEFPDLNQDIKFEVWDTAGQERFATLGPMYYRNAQAALVVYDVTQPRSFGKAQWWVREHLLVNAPPSIVIALVGNKIDLLSNQSDGETDADGLASDEHVLVSPPAGSEQLSDSNVNTPNLDSARIEPVKSEDAQAYAEEKGLLFFETSAKDGRNVNRVFEAIANALPPEPGVKGNNSQSVNLGDGDRSSIPITSQSSADSCAC